MKKVLLLDTNLSSAPIYNFLASSGYEVAVIGGNPGDALAKSVRRYINHNYSDIDGTRNLIDKERFDYIVPGCNDRSYRVCAEINSDGRFPGLDTIGATDAINRKDQFRRVAEGIGIPVPRRLQGANPFFPVIVKPVDTYSGRGATIVRESSGLNEAISCAENMSPSGQCIMEEYVEGQLYSHTAFIVDGSVVADFMVEEHCTANPLVVDTSRVVFDYPEEVLSCMRKFVEKLAGHLRLADGLVHTQFIEKQGRVWFIEVTRRCPGDLYSQLIELSTGFKYAEAYTRPFIGKSLSVSGAKKRDWIIRHTMSLSGGKNLEYVQFNMPVHIERIVPMSLAGDLIKPSPFSRIALIFFRSRTEDEHLELYNKTVKRLLYQVVGNENV